MPIASIAKNGVYRAIVAKFRVKKMMIFNSKEHFSRVRSISQQSAI